MLLRRSQTLKARIATNLAGYLLLLLLLSLLLLHPLYLRPHKISRLP